MTKQDKNSQGFLKRLRHDQGGNTLAIVAAAFIPMAGLIGGGVDMSRLYLVKTRLQQACDAGALAGRKAMGSGTFAFDNYAARETAENMFETNFEDDAYGTDGLTKTFTETAGRVNGTATVTVPMTVMKIFSQEPRTLTVTCDAEMRIPNTDVMFVLDNTGSMAWCPNGSSSCNGNASSRIAGLRSAVKCFYEALAKLNSEEDCGSTPSGGNSNTVQLRFGFVPYSSNVNVGKLLPNAWLADNWTYQSREANFRIENVLDGYTEGTASLVDTSQSNTTGNWSGWSTWQTINNVASRNACDALVPADNYVGNGSEGAAYGTNTYASGSNQITEWYTDEPATRYTYDRESYSNNTDVCKIERRSRNAKITRTYRRTDTPNYTSTQVFDNWTYKPVTFDVSGLKAGGSTWNNTVDLPIGVAGANTPVTWDGCIEERQTVRNTDGDPTGEFHPIPAAAKDMDIDLVPINGDTTTVWGPLLANAVWGRYTVTCGWWSCSNTNSYNNITTPDYLNFNNSYACPTEAKLLQPWNTAAAFDAYVNSLTPVGSTYHDIGLAWGARLMSPTGLFAASNAFTPNGGQIERHLIFMTDGDTSTNNMNITYHGLPWYDRRQTNTSSAPTNALMNSVVNERTAALCTAIKNKNITLWVIVFGTDTTNATRTRMEACATPGKYYDADDSATLIANFKQIADEISQLRLTS